MLISKRSSLEMILQHSKKIPIFKNMDEGEICALVGKSKTRTIDKDDNATMEGISNPDMHIILYGTFDVFIKNKKVEELTTGDMFGVGSIIKENIGAISNTTIQGTSYKNLLISFRVNPSFIEPCPVSSRFYQNIAKYFAHKLSVAHKNFNVPA